ncbi:hypothetical protein EV359DRAFT_80704 [Lentinula novae-zelandiae]|nr:hypothetical protein EV359DRAFT_80704 [Lentinula novae-zelandiae]
MSVPMSSALDLVPLVLDEVTVHTDIEPQVYDEWSTTPTPTTNDMPRTSLIDSVCALLASDGSKSQAIIARARKPFDINNAVLELLLSDRVVFVRKLSHEASSDLTSRWFKGRCVSEVSVLRWFELVAPDLPVPRVLAVNETKELIVTTLLPGLDAVHAYPRMDALAKERSVLSYARFAVRMFQIPAPQRFGTPYDLNGPALLLGSHIGFSPEHCFDVSESTDLQSFFNGLIDSRLFRSSIYHKSDPSSHSLLSLRLTRLREGIQPLIAEVTKDPILSRFVLAHQDTRSNNLILEPVSGEISGAVDWEYCGCLPAAMAAQYPEWIRPPIDESLQYRNPKDTFLHYTFELKAERERLCDLYEECVKGLDQEFWNCLVLGTRLRDAYTWIALSNGDLDGEAMDRWVTDHLFGSTANHRCT